MANVTVGHAIDMVLEVLGEDQTTPEHWTKENLLNWYNLAGREVVSLAPDANTLFEAIKLAAGVKQSIPVNRIGLIDVIRNMGVDGITPGPGITKSDSRILTTFQRAWINATSSAVIKNWAPESLAVFFVSPPSDGTTYVEIKVASVPDKVIYDSGGLWESALVGVGERYVGAILSWILFRAYQKDSDFPGNDNRSKEYYQQFRIACGAGQGTG